MEYVKINFITIVGGYVACFVEGLLLYSGFTLCNLLATKNENVEAACPKIFFWKSSPAEMLFCFGIFHTKSL